MSFSQRHTFIPFIVGFRLGAAKAAHVLTIAMMQPNGFDGIAARLQFRNRKISR
jgi:hypothetical protein